MKLKRIMSLVLALVLAVSLFSSVVVSAADTAELKFVVLDGETEVSGELEKGKVYTLDIVLDDISTGKVAGVEFKLSYNSDVMQFVDASGAVASGAAAFTTTVSGGLIPFGTPVAGDGVIEYAVAPDVAGNASLALEIKNNGLDVGSSFVVTKMSFKAIADGKLDIKLHEDNKLNVAIPGKAEATVAPSTQRVGKIAYVSAEADKDFAASKTYVVGKTNADTIIADLAKDYAAVSVTYTDEEGGTVSKEMAITWKAASDFDADAAGSYTFTGTVANPEDISYTGAAVTVSATVVLDTLKVQAVDAIDDITARVDDTVTLPSVVGVTVTGGDKAELAVTWEPATVDTTAAGTFDFVGTIAGTDNIDADGKTASVKVTVLAASEDTAPAAVDAVEVEAAIDAADIEADALAALPAFVIVGTDVKSYINVTWEQTSETPEEGYALGDVITFKPVADGVTFPEDFAATATVAVPAGKDSVVFNATSYETEDIKSNAGYTIADAIEDAAFTAKYADGTAVDLSTIVWAEDTIPAYDNETAGVYTLTGTWSDIYDNEQTLTITINIVNAGATGIKLYNSASSVNPISSITMDTVSKRTVYAKLEPVGVTDTVTWTVQNTSYATVQASPDTLSATISTKAIDGVVNITATTSTGATATVRLVINKATVVPAPGGNSGSPVGTPYKKDDAAGVLLAQGAEEEAQKEIAQSSSFTDLGGYEWAATQIETLRLLGIVSGKSATTFAPADSVTRAEFLAMLVRLFGFQLNGTPKAFTDVSTSDWFYDTVNIASSLGIAYGYENGAFDPNAVISRQDMAVFAERALKVSGITPVVGLRRTFTDQATISDYALEQVLYMTSIGAINGMEDGSFRAQETANRAQAAAVIYNLYVLKNK